VRRAGGRVSWRVVTLAEPVGVLTVSAGRGAEVMQDLAASARQRTGTRLDSRMEASSVVRVGMVKWRVTVSPERSARSLVTGAGRCNDGGCGTPGLAQPESTAKKDAMGSSRP